MLFCDENHRVAWLRLFFETDKQKRRHGQRVFRRRFSLLLTPSTHPCKNSRPNFVKIYYLTSSFNPSGGAVPASGEPREPHAATAAGGQLILFLYEVSNEKKLVPGS